jgi:hypothetical protein
MVKFQSKEETAKWLGHESVLEMESYRETLRLQLCSMFGVHSYGKDLKQGRKLDGKKADLVVAEEDAIMYVQRWLNKYGIVFNETEADYK